ncbi:MAG: hypothetical protein QM758_08360 [Armatimonas sp.]
MVEPVVQLRVQDRRGRALPGVKLRIRVWIRGIVRNASGSTQPITRRFTFVATTDGEGQVYRDLRPSYAPTQGPWLDGDCEIIARPVSLSLAYLTLRSPDSNTLTLYDAPDEVIEGFPLWHGAGGRGKRIVVLLEGFDFSGGFSAAQSLKLVGGAADPLRAMGFSVLVVSFTNPYAPPEVNAAEAARAVQAASRAAGGAEVILAGLSAGGIVARWALTSGRLPVHTLMLLDSPNRGARIAPKLQALAMAYAGPTYQRAVTSAAARALVRDAVEDVRRDIDWRYVGVRPFGWRFPERTRTTSRFSDSAYARLRERGKNGYPDYCRLVAIANSSRQSGNHAKHLLSAWLPLGYRWNLAAEDADRVPGSLLPKAALSYTFRLPLGVAGATLPELPVFIPAESALDASLTERPPFDAWYERHGWLPPIPHDEIAPDVAAFVVRELSRI